MADRDFNTQQDNAYIEDLLSKLRQTLGQTSNVEENPEPVTSEALTTSVEVLKGEETVTDAKPTEEISTPQVPEEGTDVLIVESNTSSEDPVPEVVEQMQEELPPFMPIPDGIADIPLSIENEIVDEPVQEQVTDATVEMPAEPVQTDIFETYSHTVLPVDSRIDSRHPSGDYALRMDEWEDEEKPGVDPLPPEKANEEVEFQEQQSLEELLPDALDIPAIADVEAEMAQEVPAEEPPTVPEVNLSQEKAPKVAEISTVATARDAIVDLFQDVDTSYEPPLYEPFEEASFDAEIESITPVYVPEPTREDNIRSVTARFEEIAGVEKTSASSSLEKEAHPSVHVADCRLNVTKKTVELRDAILEEPLESMGGLSSEKQKNAWKQEIYARVRKAKISVAISGALLFVLALFELIPALHRNLLERLLLTRVQGAALLIDLQLLLLICLFGWRGLWRGISALVKRTYLPESFAFLAASLSAIVTVVLLVSRTSMPLLCGLMGALPMFVATLADYFRLVSARYAYRACITDDHTYAAVKSDLAEHSLLGPISGAYSVGTPLTEVKNATSFDDLVAGCRCRKEERKPLAISLILAAALAFAEIIVLLILLILKQPVLYSLWSSTMVICAVMPLAHFLHHRVFFASLSSRIAKERVAVSGEEAVYAFAKTKVMTYDDTEAFPAGSVKINGIKLCGDFPLDKALFLMASLFDRVGGPLGGIFRGSAADMTLADTVELTEIVPGGICAEINHETVHVGTKEYLEDRGIEVFTEAEDDHADEYKNRVLYVAYCGRHAAKFHVHYEVCPAFESNTEYHAKHGVFSVILTADPLISEELLETITYVSDYQVRVVCKDIESLSEAASSTREASLLTYGPKRSLRRMPFFFNAYGKLQRWSITSSVVLNVLLAIALPLSMVFTRTEGVWLPFLAQLLCTAPSAILASLVLLFNPNPPYKEPEENTNE